MDVVKILPGLPTVTSRIAGDMNAFQRILDANEVEKTVKNKNIFMVNSTLLHMTEELKKKIKSNAITALHVVTD